MKPLTTAQAALMRKNRGKVQEPTRRSPAPDLPPLSPQERAQELAEERRFNAGWRERKSPPKAIGRY